MVGDMQAALARELDLTCLVHQKVSACSAHGLAVDDDERIALAWRHVQGNPYAVEQLACNVCSTCHVGFDITGRLGSDENRRVIQPSGDWCRAWSAVHIMRESTKKLGKAELTLKRPHEHRIRDDKKNVGKGGPGHRAIGSPVDITVVRIGGIPRAFEECTKEMSNLVGNSPGCKKVLMPQDIKKFRRDVAGIKQVLGPLEERALRREGVQEGPDRVVKSTLTIEEEHPSRFVLAEP